MILCSRAKCGCLASALLSGDGPRGEITEKDIKEFTLEEEQEGHIVKWEDRKFVWAERCEQHEREYILSHPDYLPCRYCKKECKCIEAIVCKSFEPSN